MSPGTEMSASCGSGRGNQLRASEFPIHSSPLGGQLLMVYWYPSSVTAQRCIVEEAMVGTCRDVVRRYFNG